MPHIQQLDEARCSVVRVGTAGIYYNPSDDGCGWQGPYPSGRQPPAPREISEAVILSVVALDEYPIGDYIMSDVMHLSPSVRQYAIGRGTCEHWSYLIFAESGEPTSDSGYLKFPPPVPP